MSTAVLVCLAVGSIVFSIASSGICLWLMALCCRVPNISVRRAMGAMLLLAVVNVVLGVLTFWVESGVFSALPAVHVLLPLAILGLELFLSFLIVKRALRTTTGRALLVFVTTATLNIIVAFSAALAFRAEVAEAFVTPTGSEAIAIYGRHHDVKCSNCGYTFAVAPLRNDEGPMEQMMTVCPNCGLASSLPRGAATLQGDHFLVDKTTGVKRWDIIAFKMPKEHANYIKLLIGLPGETIAVAHGHIFINGKELHRDPNANSDLWIPVIDSRFVASQQTPNWLHWSADAGSHWTNTAGKWSCNATKSDGDVLQLQGTISDWLAYNNPYIIQLPKPLPVGDVKLECSIGSFSGDGTLTFHWRFAGPKLTVEIASDGNATLVAAATGDAADTATAKGKLSKPISAGQRLALAVRDGRGYLSENDRTVASVPIEGDKFKPQSEDDIKAENEVEPCKIAISARGCSVDLSRIAVFRDAYFRSALEMERPNSLGPEPLKLAADEFFVLGQNSTLSNDSRTFGPIKTDTLIGVARWIYWPMQRWHAF